ncbi:MAG: IS110 family transposase [Candidatus Staskawiczbacteria bacterium]
MEVVHVRCCGLDVHKKVIEACIIVPEGKMRNQYGTMTDDLKKLVTWLQEHQVKVVAMESTGVYWKPIYNILELAGFEILVVNAQHIKAVPGRKTDVKDAEWIAMLLRLGLLKGSYIPNREQRELRELLRYRTKLVEERGREVQRMQKILEGANIKLSSVATNIMGSSGRSMIEAMIDKIEDPRVLAKLAQKRLKNKREDLERALNGLMGEHQRMMLQVQLKHIDFLDESIENLDKELAERKKDDTTFHESLDLLDGIPGVGVRIAQAILVEVGTDMNRFPSADHLAAWAGMAPGNNESAGKRKSGRARPGNSHLRTVLIQAAHAAARVKSSYLSDQYQRIAARRGSKRAAVAVGHSILVMAYHILNRREPYKELGHDYYQLRRKDVKIKHHCKELLKLGIVINLDASTQTTTV